MKKILALAAALVLLLTVPASSTLVTKPFIFSPNTTIYSSQVNADFDTLYSVINGGLDNTNIGSAGIFASQIIPTNTAQATFGGALGYTIAPNVATQVPLAILGSSGQSANLFSVNLAGPIDAFHISPSGRSNVAGGLVFPAPTTALAPGVVEAVNDNAAVGGLVLNVPTGSTNGFSFDVNGTPVASISNTGALTVGSFTLASPLSIANGGTGSSTKNFVDLSTTQTIAGAKTFSNAAVFSSTLQAVGVSATTGTVQGSSNGSTTGYVPPVYGPSGAALASTVHVVTGLTSSLSWSGGCSLTGAVCASASTTLSGAAAFTSASSYQCTLSGNNIGTGGPQVINIINTSGTAFTAYLYQGPYAAASATYPFICVGT
jgi:hypothetical protein